MNENKIHPKNQKTILNVSNQFRKKARVGKIKASKRMIKPIKNFFIITPQ